MEFSMFNWFSYMFTIVTIIFGLFYFYAKYKLSYWRRKGVKSPPAHIIFGNMKDSILFKKMPGQVLKDIYYSVDPNEPIVGCYIFHKPLLIIRDRDLIKQMMVKDFEVFPNRGFGGDGEADTLGYVNLLGLRKPKWKYVRTKLTPCLTGQKLRSMTPLIVECAKNLMKHIKNEKTDAGGFKTFELKSTGGKYSTDVFASVAFGITTNSFDESNTQFWEAGQRVLAGMKRGIILMIHFFLPEMVRITSLVAYGPAKYFRTIFWDSYMTRERVGNKRGDLIDSLMDLKNGEQNPDFVFDGDNLVAQAVSFFVAGFEATSTAIAFALFELSRNPEHEERVYEEVMRVVGTGELNLEMIKKMTFLDKCINESLRLHPPLPMADRIAIKDYKIPGMDVTLPKGSTIYVATSGTNTDPRFFKDPEVFDPARTESDSGFSEAHLSFGIGPRSCIGQRLGLVIAKVAIATILIKYTLVCESSVDHELNAATPFTTVIDGIKLRMRKRIFKHLQ